MIRALWRVSLLVAALAGCTDPEGPTGREPLAIVTSPPVTDTILAQPVQSLVVEVRDAQGAVLGDVAVRFTPLGVDTMPFQPSMAVANEASASFGSLAAVRTSSRGRASALVQFGPIAGPGRIEITVPELGLADTAVFNVRPGAAASVLLVPRDTSVSPGASFAIRGGVRDRFGNLRPDPVTFAVVAVPAGSGSVTASGTFTATSPGRVAVVGTAGTATDSAIVSVVPSGAIAAYDWSTGHFVLVNTDGTGRRNLTLAPVSPNADNNEPAWSPDGTEILFVLGGLPTFLRVSTGNLSQILDPRPPGFTAAYWPAFRPNSQQIYFSADAGSGAFRIWRVDRTGANLQQVTGGTFDVRASFAPHGQTFTYHAVNDAGEVVIRIFSLTTGTNLPFDVPGLFPEWSPDGQRIAYFTNQNVLHVMQADGANDRTLVAGRYGAQPIAWSPDGEWLTVRSDVIELVGTRPGPALVLRLAFSGTLTAPIWRPN